jgi:UDP-N-acetylmuramate--alanine ligase
MMDFYKNIFFVGIKGVAMANLARIFQQMGKQVSGSDVEESFITDDELKNANIEIIYSFDPSKLPDDVDLVIYSAAHKGTLNPQVQEAKNRGIEIKHQAEIVGNLTKEFKTSIAVAGCHGKTTTSSLLAFALSGLNKNPSYLVGVSTFNDKYGGEYVGKDYFVVEADEYGLNPPSDITPKFHFIHPSYTIITNIDFDHPDVYKDIEETKKAFEIFIENIPEEKHRIIAWGDDKNIQDILSKLSPERYVTYGKSETSDVQIVEIEPTPTGTKFQIKINAKLNAFNNLLFEIVLFGEKNVLNATAVITFLIELGLSPTQINNSISDFNGAKRRFELKKKIGETYLFDDYAHHPEEIEATIAAARMRFPDKKIKVIFQPHTYSRTSALQQQFITALSKADAAYLLPVFGSAREKKSVDSVESEHLVNLAKKQGIETIYSYTTQEELLKNLHIETGDIIFTMGAGDVYKLENSITSLFK